jgi:DNA repair exonuclease SbcCD ATPase subunit
VNVITGSSGTGKTAILQIIDYCLFASEHKISEDIINENVMWYGINFMINDNNYTIAREAPKFKKVSNNYYFSSLIQPIPTIKN